MRAKVPLAPLLLVIGCTSAPAEVGKQATRLSDAGIVPLNGASPRKMDLLLAVDNSARMGTKQAFLARTVATLVRRLAQPACLDAAGAVVVESTGDGACPAGSRVEFPAITDLHVGVLTSDMGGFGSDQCTGANDRGRLVARGKDALGKDVKVTAEPGSFLAWQAPGAPVAPANGAPPPLVPYTDIATLSSAVGDLVRGAGQNGCGLEAQLESIYHFLSAPDPYLEVGLLNGRAYFAGIDQALLAQRHAFLRPDSQVAVVLLTDEDDSSADPLSVGGQGYAFMSANFPAPGSVVSSPGRRRPDDARFGGGTTAARGTSTCDLAPGAAECTSCAFQFSCDPAKPSCSAIKADPNCVDNGGYHRPEDDILNVRFHHMKRRFGVDPQYPVSRYIQGLSRPYTPRSDKEHDATGAYVGDAACLNPLFARVLPASVADDGSALDAAGQKILHADGSPATLCDLPRGFRTAQQITFAVIGGAPNSLNVLSPASAALPDPWVSLVGRKPEAYDDTGADPRMVQSTTPRVGRPPASAPDSPAVDPLNEGHREYDTRGAELQYACTFPLSAPLPYTNDPTYPCANGSDAPLCDGPRGTPSRRQLREGAFPSLRPFEVARGMGAQGIALSICPEEVNDTASTAYGYAPLVPAIAARVQRSQSGRSCLPEAPPVRPDGTLACAVWEVAASETGSCDAPWLREPTADERARFFRDLGSYGAKGWRDAEDAKRHVCVVRNVPAGADGCAGAARERGDGSGEGFCYLGAGTPDCERPLEITERAFRPGALFVLHCPQ
jgi:hypothetical protein